MLCPAPLIYPGSRSYQPLESRQELLQRQITELQNNLATEQDRNLELRLLLDQNDAELYQKDAEIYQKDAEIYQLRQTLAENKEKILNQNMDGQRAPRLREFCLIHLIFVLDFRYTRANSIYQHLNLGLKIYRKFTLQENANHKFSSYMK